MNKQLKEQLLAAGYTISKCYEVLNGVKNFLGYKILNGEKQVNRGEYASIQEMLDLVKESKNELR